MRGAGHSHRYPVACAQHGLGLGQEPVVPDHDDDAVHTIAVEYLRSCLLQAGFVPSMALVVAFYVLLRGARDTMWRVALLSLPGTIAHELAHVVVGFLLHAGPAGFSIWPRPRGNGWTLGSVSFRNIGLLNGAFIAVAPLLLLA